MSGFTVDFVCPVEFENLAAEISFQGQLICRIKSEREDKIVEADFFYDYREPLRSLALPLEEFLDLVSEIKDEIVDLRARREGGKGGRKQS